MLRLWLSTLNWSHNQAGTLGDIALSLLRSSTPGLGSGSCCRRPPGFPSCSLVPLAHPARLLHATRRPDRVPSFPTALGTMPRCSDSLWVVPLTPPPLPPPHSTLPFWFFASLPLMSPIQALSAYSGFPDPSPGVVCLLPAFLIYRPRSRVPSIRSLERVHRGSP